MADSTISGLADDTPKLTDELLARRGNAPIKLPLGDLIDRRQRRWQFTGNGNVTVPDWAAQVVISAVAPGGGGGGVAAVDSTAAGGGSSGQSLFKVPFDVTPGQIISVVCSDWSGGAGAAAGLNNGAGGATLTISGAGLDITLFGGQGGFHGGSSNSMGRGGASSGPGSQPGWPGFIYIGGGGFGVWPGRGGGSPFGEAPAGNTEQEQDGAGDAAPGVAAVHYGCGGSGARSRNNSPSSGGAKAGGKGGPAIVILEFV